MAGDPHRSVRCGVVRRLVLIANPVASGFTAAMHREVTRILTGPYDVTAVWPESPQSARSQAADAAAEGYDVVAAMGGDGVVHQVANSLIGTNTALGVIPVGTTNVLARVLGIPSKAADAAEGLVSGDIRPISVASVRADSASGTRDDLALFAAGIGLDAEVVAKAERNPLRKVSFGALHYARSTASILLRDFRRRLPTMRVTAGDTSADATTVLVQVHDLYTLVSGAPLRLGPGSNGLTVAVIERTTATRITRAISRGLTSRDIAGIGGIDVWQDVSRVVIEADPPAWFEADGELLGRAFQIEVAIDERPLLVVTP